MLLTIQNIQKYFGAELCLRNISCVLDAQDRAGIISENGAGKTTLLSILTAQNTHASGLVTYNGERVWDNQKALDEICFSS